MGTTPDQVGRGRDSLLGLVSSLSTAMAIALFAFTVLVCRVEVDGGAGFQYSNEYRKLSQTPYAPSFLQSRSLMPLLAWTSGLTGPNYAYFSLVVVYVFLVACALYLLRATSRTSTAFMGVLLLSTLPLTEFNMYAPGWPDQFCGLLFVLTLLAPSVSLITNVVGLLAHEFYTVLLVSSVVIIPRPWYKRLLHLVAPLGLVWASGKMLNFPPGGADLPPSIRGFVADPSWQIIGQPVLLGFASAMKVFIVLIPYALCVLWRDRRGELYAILTPILLAASCLLLAHDTTRIWGLALPAIIVTIRSLSRNQWLLAAACIANFLLPSYGISSAWQVHLERVVGWAEILYIAVVKSIAI
jgi:hypothetical protein